MSLPSPRKRRFLPCGGGGKKEWSFFNNLQGCRPFQSSVGQCGHGVDNNTGANIEQVVTRIAEFRFLTKTFAEEPGLGVSNRTMGGVAEFLSMKILVARFPPGKISGRFNVLLVFWLVITLPLPPYRGFTATWGFAFVL